MVPNCIKYYSHFSFSFPIVNQIKKVPNILEVQFRSLYSVLIYMNDKTANHIQHHKWRTSISTFFKRYSLKLCLRFTQRNLLRVYPKGLRLDSSNYNPMLGWTHGAQMVAFNMQVRLHTPLLYFCL